MRTRAFSRGKKPSMWRFCERAWGCERARCNARIQLIQRYRSSGTDSANVPSARISASVRASCCGQVRALSMPGGSRC